MKKVCSAFICLVYLLSFASCSNPSGKISEINPSPSDKYQVDEVNWSGGATAGESYLVVELSDENGFAAASDSEPETGIVIEETRYSYATDYSITWDSNDSFIAQWASPQSASFEVARITIADGEYTISSGSVYIDLEDSFFSDFETDGDIVHLTCQLRLYNDFDESVRVTLDGRAGESDIGQLLSDGELLVLNESGEPLVYELEPCSSEYLTVVFTGSKGPGDTKTDRNLPPWIYLHYYN